jgi:HSP20 family protein
MDTNEEKFFKELAGTAAEADEQYEIELAKSSTGAVASRSKASPKQEESFDQKWDDGEPEGQLTVDVYQTTNDIVVQSAIAGVRPEDIDISATPDAITIRGARKHDKEVKDENYLHQECYWGRFTRSVIFTQEVDPENASVNFKNGILTVRLPKVDKKKSKQLKIKAE